MSNVVIVDDLIATGGSAKAAKQLVEMTGAHVISCLFVVELVDLDGKALLDCDVHSVFKY